MLFATASQAALERSSTGRTRTWFRTPTRPLSRLYPRNVALLRSMLCDLNGTLEWLSPALGLDIVHVSVLAHLDRRSEDRKSTRLNSSHVRISYAVFCLKKKKQITDRH